MNGLDAVGAGATTPPRDDRDRLRRPAHELEGVFLNQLFQAMRASVPRDGILEDAPGQEMFTSVLDEKLASEAAARSQRGVGEALFRQLSRRLAAAPKEGSR